MAKPKQLPSGSWRALVYAGKDNNGKRLYESITAPTEKECNYAVLEYQLKKKGRSKPENITLGDAIDRYIASKDAVLSPSTISGYKKIQKNNLQDIVNLKLNKINQEIIQIKINALSKILSPKSVRNAHGLLSAVLNEYQPDLKLRTTLPKKQKQFRNIPNEKDILKILQAATGTKIEIPILLAVWLSLRMSEVRGLKWENVHEDYIIINEAIVDADDGPASKGTKTYAGTRKISLSPSLKKRLDLEPHNSEYITDLSGQAIYKRFIRLQNKIGVGPYRFHDLRHANASIMLKLGIPDKYAMDRGGWETDSTLKSVYQHVLNDEKTLVDRKIDTYFENLMQHEMQHENRK